MAGLSLGANLRGGSGGYNAGGVSSGQGGYAAASAPTATTATEMAFGPQSSNTNNGSPWGFNIFGISISTGVLAVAFLVWLRHSLPK